MVPYCSDLGERKRKHLFACPPTVERKRSRENNKREREKKHTTTKQRQRRAWCDFCGRTWHSAHFLQNHHPSNPHGWESVIRFFDGHVRNPANSAVETQSRHPRLTSGWTKGYDGCNGTQLGSYSMQTTYLSKLGVLLTMEKVPGGLATSPVKR
eukprot:scaffold4603_cov175-Amphora_coffeaeformis.AAC.2